MAQGLLLLRPFVGSAIAAPLPSNASNLKSAQLYREPCFSTEFGRRVTVAAKT